MEIVLTQNIQRNNVRKQIVLTTLPRVVFQFGLSSLHGCRLLLPLKNFQDTKATNAKGEIKVYPFRSSAEFILISPYRKQPHRPQTKYWPSTHGGISPTYIMSYRHINIFIYTDKRNTQSHRSNASLATKIKNANITGNKCTNDFRESIRHVM